MEIIPQSLLVGLVSQIDVGTRGKAPIAPFDHIVGKYMTATGTPTRVRSERHGHMHGFQLGASDYFSIIIPESISPAAQGITLASAVENDDTANGSNVRWQDSGSARNISLEYGYFSGNSCRGSWNAAGGNDSDRVFSIATVQDETTTACYSVKDGAQRIELAEHHNAAETVTLDATIAVTGDFTGFDTVTWWTEPGRNFWSACWDRALTTTEQYALVKFKGNPFVELAKPTRRFLPVGSAAAAPPPSSSFVHSIHKYYRQLMASLGR